ncbi:MAG: VanW family protein [Clostridiales bacterium]|nr:VanW family protein [Clostridiales bacterium]
MQNKKLLFWITIFVLLFSYSAWASTNSTPLYEAQVNTDFQLRQAPQEEAKRIQLVPKRATVLVYHVGDEWSFIQYNGKDGYAKNKWLWLFIAIDFQAPPLPGYHNPSGVAMTTKPLQLETTQEKQHYRNALPSGSQITLLSFDNKKQADLLYMREILSIDPLAVDFLPFTSWESPLPGEILGGYTTYYNETLGGKLTENRNHNILLAAERINTFTVQPNESFSFNQLCGPYTGGNGYFEAPNISTKGTGYGGGVCQVSTTLYNAVLSLPLQVTAWRIHQNIGVAYAPVAFDAAVGNSTGDFSFINTLPYPITLSILPQEGILTVLISRSTQQDSDK